MTELENLKKKVLYRSNYRGTKEMDILLSRFVNKYINSLSVDDLKKLNEFLDISDDELSNFYLNNKTTEEISNNPISKIFKNFKI
jgi:antitoxin CptB|tara:strand:+ start:750 stop:1004 length:255 start_codon:yes stop_codon:yes gene_type:complete